MFWDVLEASWGCFGSSWDVLGRPGGVSEASLGVFEGSDACVRTSKDGKAMLGKASQRFSDRTDVELGVLKPPSSPPSCPARDNFIFGIPQ